MVLAVNITSGILFKVLIGIAMFIVGTVIFSYLNLVIAILPEGIEEEEDEGEGLSKEERRQQKIRKKEIRRDKWHRLIRGKKICPHCGKEWKGKDTLPILSWFINGRKCVYCFEKISPRYTLIELLGGVLAVLPIVYYGLNQQAITVFFVYCVLAVIAIIDMDTQYIPPELNILLAVLGLISIWTIPGPTIVERLIGVVCISVPLLIITLIVPGAFGGGDIKMMAAVGLLLGWKGTVIAFLIGLFLGGGYGAYVLVTKKLGRKEHFAFGPFLAIGIAISLYAGLGIRLMDVYVNYIVSSFTQY